MQRINIMKPLHNWIPMWMLSKIKNKACDKCGQAAKKENIISVGFRQIEKGNVVYLEHKCSGCDFRSLTYCSNDIALEDMCYILIEEIQQKRQIEKVSNTQKKKNRNKNNKNPLTDKEIDDFVEYMQNSPNFDDFLNHIGASKYLQNEKPDDKN